MVESSLGRFVVTVAVSLAVVVALAAVLTPPDPFSQLRFVGIAMFIALPLAYYLSYRGGFSRFTK